MGAIEASDVPINIGLGNCGMSSPWQYLKDSR